MVNSDWDIGVKHVFLHASVQPIAVAGGIMLSGCVSGSLILVWCLRNAFREFLQIWNKHPFELKDEPIRLCWLEVKVTVTFQ